MLVDQHAAHERVRLEGLVAGECEGGVIYAYRTTLVISSVFCVLSIDESSSGTILSYMMKDECVFCVMSPAGLTSASRAGLESVW